MAKAEILVSGPLRTVANSSLEPCGNGFATYSFLKKNMDYFTDLQVILAQGAMLSFSVLFNLCICAAGARIIYIFSNL